ncbi:hypothetical protein M404DRAFT_10006 [Pisolithus tinctorius Marx 270]|uniref:Uncharacterized protein n=1 Tax=Pisolithus tinctorius Marx 270 TaxID=870435 RepID=A0A0C3NKT2_PISTI|nr:hypothetical protein M404DRAFT_10006 [Pisolithus tinctorius Marx 270]
MTAVEIARQAWMQAASAHLKESTQGDVCNLNTTAGLNYAKNGSNQPGSDKIKIAIEVHIKGSSNEAMLVNSMAKVLEDSLAALNITWKKEEGMSFILTYILSKSADLYRPKDPKSKDIKGLAIFFELFFAEHLDQVQREQPAMAMTTVCKTYKCCATQGSSSDEEFNESISVKQPPRKQACWARILSKKQGK